MIYFLKTDDQQPKKASRLWQANFPFAPSNVPFFYGWVIVAIATMAILFSIPGQTMGFAVFTDILIEQLGLSRVQLSFAYFIGTIFSGFTLPYLGRVFDRLGARRMVVYSSVATAIVLVYLSQSRRILDAVPDFIGRTVAAFIIITIGFYLIRASAQGVLTLSGRNAIGKWFDYNRGKALAVSGVAVAFGFAFAPRALDFLISLFGWSGAWIFLGVITLGLMATLGWVFIRDNPEECGLVMDGLSASNKVRRHNADAIAHRDYTRAEALGTWAFWAFNLSFAFWSMFGTAATFHIVSIGESTGHPRAEIIGYFVPMAVISVMMNVFCGWASTYMRLKYLLIMMNLAALAGFYGTLELETKFGLWCFIGGYGVCGGAFAALTGIVWPRFFGRASLGAISGVGMSSMVIASAIGPLFFSLSKYYTGGYETSLYLSAIFPAMLLVGSFWADNPQRGEG
ncbi:MAG: OFA family oxalate/formate antiporter-like MFS transporter [Verrucomicrobiales bacterium]|jgi:OFA family oxalate/formate antiporter-like MFS transporter